MYEDEEIKEKRLQTKFVSICRTIPYGKVVA